MGALLQAVTRTGRLLGTQPLVLLAVVATSGVAIVGGFLSGFVPTAGAAVFLLVVQPVALAGLLHVGNTAVDGTVGARTYLTGIRRHTSGLLLAFVLLAVIFSLLGGLGVYIVFMGGFTGVFDVTTGIVAVAILVAAMAVGLQFVDASVIVDREGVRAAIEHSWEALVRHPLTVLGYTTVRLASLALLVASARVLLRGPGLLTDVRLGGTDAVVVAVVICVAGYLGTVLHVVVYREIAV